MSRSDKFIVLALALAAMGVLSLGVIAMDSLTYGKPPGLFKNDVWQFIRQLWT